MTLSYLTMWSLSPLTGLKAEGKSTSASQGPLLPYAELKLNHFYE